MSEYRQTPFKEDSLVRHITTGKVYRILFNSSTCRLEKDDMPAYAYQRQKLYKEKVSAHDLKIIWVRAAAIMEKKFVTAPEVGYADIYGPDPAAQAL